MTQEQIQNKSNFINDCVEYTATGRPENINGVLGIDKQGSVNYYPMVRIEDFIEANAGSYNWESTYGVRFPDPVFIIDVILNNFSFQGVNAVYVNTSLTIKERSLMQQKNNYLSLKYLSDADFRKVDSVFAIVF